MENIDTINDKPKRGRPVSLNPSDNKVNIYLNDADMQRAQETMALLNHASLSSHFRQVYEEGLKSLDVI